MADMPDHITVKIQIETDDLLQQVVAWRDHFTKVMGSPPTHIILPGETESRPMPEIEIEMPELTMARSILAELFFYINWKNCSSPLTAAQKEYWADVIEVESADHHGHDGIVVDRWWR